MSDTKSLLILGRQPSLGLAELESLYGASRVAKFGAKASIVAKPASEIDFKRLGGSTRLANIIAELPTNNWRLAEKELATIIPELASNLDEGKIKLGLSAYGLNLSPAKLNASGLSLKKIIRERTGRSVRLVPNQDLELSSAQVIHNHLTGGNGIEILIITSSNATVIARTTKVQDIASYSLRDRGRPKRDAKVGMLPPKLAQIIINLATGNLPRTINSEYFAEELLLDPFCGTGVVLIEAGLMGYDTVGSDIDARMVAYSEQNFRWAKDLIDKQTFRPGLIPEGNGDYYINLSVGDATSHKWISGITSVASETYLGRPFTSQPSSEILSQTISECNLIIKKFLANIHGQLDPGARLCLAVPAWQTSPNHFRYLPLVENLEDLGYNRVEFEHVPDNQLLYFREDQIVARQLLVLTRK